MFLHGSNSHYVAATMWSLPRSLTSGGIGKASVRRTGCACTVYYPPIFSCGCGPLLLGRHFFVLLPPRHQSSEDFVRSSSSAAVALIVQVALAVLTVGHIAGWPLTFALLVRMGSLEHVAVRLKSCLDVPSCIGHCAASLPSGAGGVFTKHTPWS